MAAAAVYLAVSFGVLLRNCAAVIGCACIFPGYPVYLECAVNGAYVCDASILSGIDFAAGGTRGAAVEPDVSFCYIFPNAGDGRYFAGTDDVCAVCGVCGDLPACRGVCVCQDTGPVYILFVRRKVCMARQAVVQAERVGVRFRMAKDRAGTLKEFAVRFLSGKLKYQELEALHDVTFQIRKGDVLGIIGHNGAGKSTLLKVISGIMKPSSGSVAVQGRIVPMLELGSGFDFEMTGRENVFLNGAILGYTESFLQEQYREIVDFSGLGAFMDAPLRTYSSGMVMRLAFSIASAVYPEILIVDEILAVGDADFQDKSRNRMMQMMSGGTTVLFVSHDLEQVREMCSKVLWLEHGNVVAFGKTKEICDRYASEGEKKF